MSNDDSLDAFLTADVPAEEKKNNKDTSLEDEFAKLLNDFINQDKPAAKPDNKKYEDITISENDTFYIIGKVLV